MAPDQGDSSNVYCSLQRLNPLPSFLKFLPVKKELSKKLAAYSSMAVAALLATKNSDAQIIYTNPPDIYLAGVGDYAMLDLNNDGIYDVKVYIFDSYPVPCYASPGYAVEISNIDSSNNVQGLMYSDCQGSFFYGYGILPRKNGQLITQDVPSGAIWYRIQLGEVLNWDYYGGTCHRWAGKKRFAGFRMRASGADFNYGWIRLSVNYTASKTTIHDWAIKSQVNEPIYAGQTMEPADLKLQLPTELQIYSYGKEIIVIQNSQTTSLEISIFNLLGVEMSHVNSSEVDIRLNTSLAPGIYIVKVTRGNEIISKQVLIE